MRNAPNDMENMSRGKGLELGLFKGRHARKKIHFYMVNFTPYFYGLVRIFATSFPAPPPNLMVSCTLRLRRGKQNNN